MIEFTSEGIARVCPMELLWCLTQETCRALESWSPGAQEPWGCSHILKGCYWTKGYKTALLTPDL